MPFTAASLGELHRWHDPEFDEGGTLEQWVVDTVEKARAELAAHAVRPHARLPEGESYTVFCLDAASTGIGGSAASWLEAHRPAVAALLTKEPDPAVLSDQEIAESTELLAQLLPARSGGERLGRLAGHRPAVGLR